MTYKKYPATVIAAYFIDKAKEDNVYLTPLKLMKLVYFAYGWFLYITSNQLINEPIVAWQYGPVISTLYHEFKHYGNQGITDHTVSQKDLNQLLEDSRTIAVLNKVWEEYSGYTAVQLSNMTHETDSPWDMAWNHNHGKYFNNQPISDELIKKYFEKIICNRQQQHRGL